MSERKHVVVGECPGATTLYWDPREIKVWDVRLQQWVRTSSPDDGLLATLSEAERTAILQHLPEWFAHEARVNGIIAGEIAPKADDFT